MKCGLVGRKLGHSYSPEIHALLGDYEYGLCECEPDELEGFIKSADYTGLNVTIPYKKTVMQYCDVLSERAEKIGSVNTLVRKNGKIYGHNTDYDGFLTMISSSGVDVSGKKAIILGSGGASLTAQAVLRDLGVSQLSVISRTGKDNYETIAAHYDAEIIVNATPVGMYPDCGECLIALENFTSCALVLDLIYNPAKTALLLQAESLGIKYENGLSMLVSQAKRACELFTGKDFSDDVIDKITRKLDHKMRNIILIGMPGCGKSTVGKALAELTGREFIDCDDEFEKLCGSAPGDFITEFGESAFREKESEILRTLGASSGKIIATGGGCVTVNKNFPYLRENSYVVWLRRDISRLVTSSRPLSRDLCALYLNRMPLYALAGDIQVKNEKTPHDAAEEILRRLS